MSLDTDLQARLTALAGAGVDVQQNVASRGNGQPRVWYQRSDGFTDKWVSNQTGLTETTYVIEVGAIDPSEAATIADTITTAMNGFVGLMGGTRVLGAFVADASDDYQPRQLALDDGYHVFAFNLNLITG